MNTWKLFALIAALAILVGCTPAPAPTAAPVAPSGPTQAQLDAVNKDLALWKDRATKAEQDLAKAKADAAKAQQDLAKAQADWKAYKPETPKSEPVVADPATTAILVLDLNNAKVNDATNPSSKMAPKLKGLLDKARSAKVLIVYTISLSGIGTTDGALWDGFQARPDEPVLTPDGFDKFYGGELQSTLSKKGIKTLIVTGASTNAAILYTATAAARVFNYNVIIPTDAVVANTQYQQDYSLYQFTVLPSNANKKFSFTTIDQLTFKQ